MIKARSILFAFQDLTMYRSLHPVYFHLNICPSKRGTIALALAAAPGAQPMMMIESYTEINDTTSAPFGSSIPTR